MLRLHPPTLRSMNRAYNTVCKVATIQQNITLSSSTLKHTHTQHPTPTIQQKFETNRIMTPCLVLYSTVPYGTAQNCPYQNSTVPYSTALSAHTKPKCTSRTASLHNDRTAPSVTGTGQLTTQFKPHTSVITRKQPTSKCKQGPLIASTKKAIPTTP